MNDLQLFSEGQTVIETDVVGFAPSVPEAIMGVPKSMFNRSVSDLPHMNAPLSIYFETTCPARVTKSQLVNRGVAILAFALAMSKSRAVEVYALSLSAKGHDVAYGAAVRLPTMPLDLGRVTWITASEGYSRRLGFTVVHSLEKSTDGLTKAWGTASNASRELSIRDRFQLKDSDVVITRETENLTQMITDPIGWVRDMILKNQ